MFCMSCGKQLEDNSKFCPYCGATVEEAAAPAAQTVNEAAEKPAKKPGKKFPVGLIAAVAVIAIVVVAVIARIGGGSPSAKVMAAFGKTIGEYTAVAEDMIPTDMAGFLNDGAMNQTVAFKINSVGDYMDETLKGLGGRVDLAFSKDKRDISVIATPVYGSADLLTVEAAIKDSIVYVRAADLLGEDYYSVDTTTLGQKLVDLELIDDEAETLGFNIFDLIAIIEENTAPSKEAEKELEKAVKEFAKAIEVEKTGKETVEVNEHDVKCTVYEVVIPDNAILDLLEAGMDYTDSMDREKMVESVLLAIGMPDDLVDQAMDSFEDADTDAMLESVEEFMDELGDVELEVYVSGGRISAIFWNPEIDGTEIEAWLYLGGGDVYVNDISLEISAEDVTVTIVSTGNHNGKGGTYTDELSVKVKAFGEKQTVLESEFSYAPKDKGENLTWTLKAGEIKIAIEGRMEAKKDTLSLNLSSVNVKEYGEKLIDLSLDYTIGKYESIIKAKSGIMILDMDEDEIADLMMDLQENAEELVQDLMEDMYDIDSAPDSEAEQPAEAS